MANALTPKNGDNKFPRSERVDDQQIGDANFGPDGGTAVHTQLINLNGDWKAALLNMRDLLGYHTIGAGGINRHLPKRHPLFSNLWATRLTGIKGVKYLGKLATDWGVTSDWQYLEVTVQYSTVQYDMYGDQDPAMAGGGEWRRFVIKRDRPRLEYLTTDRKDYRFWPVAPPTILDVNGSNNVINSAVAKPVCSDLVEWEWTLVPRNYVLNASGRATNVIACVGKVNDAPFPPGDPNPFPAGTLLLEEPHIEPAPAPLPPNTLLGTGAGFRDGYVTVKLPFRYFQPDPKPGLAGQGYPDWQIQGHNLYPHVSSYYWFRISTRPSNGVVPDVPRFQAADYTQIFRKV